MRKWAHQSWDTGINGWHHEDARTVRGRPTNRTDRAKEQQQREKKAAERGVKIFDITSKQRITNVPRDDISLRPDMYPCSLCWKDSVTLIIGWGTSVKICSVKERHASEMRDLPSRYVEIVSQFETEFYISGLAPLCDQLVVLSYVKEVSEKTEALMAAEISQKNIKRHKILDIGLAYINHLVDKGDYDIAARKCQKILGKNAALWEYEVYKFKEIGQLKAISPYLPRGDPVLKPLIYEMILHEFLESDYEHCLSSPDFTQLKECSVFSPLFQGFATLIREWPGDLYNNSVIVQAVSDHLKKDSQNRTLLKTLAELYTYDKNYGNALEIYLTLRHKDVFQLIHKHNLFSSIKDKIVLLMDFDSEKAVDMLLDNEDKISIKKVVEELENRPELQHVYLHKLFKRDHHKGQRYHEKQISLYAEYDRPNLLPFLRDSTHCPLEKALEICQQRNFVEETVYLLSRMGNSRSALKMIMEELHDVDKAIEFAKEQDDGELWEDLILYSIDKPPFITGLLNNIGTHVDPILLIHRIKEGMEIPNLRDSLVKILQDYNLQILLREGCKKILVADSLSLLKKMHRTQMKGVLVDDENICESCLSPVLPSDAAKPFSVVVFHCRHMFHKECLPMPSMVSWQLGSHNKRKIGAIRGLYAEFKCGRGHYGPSKL
ncbi:Vacuolar protein sorting-associated protein 41 [Galemys pyrenaicus]|uniref:Vacuolar protein sorting-associated protein 41 homolog n=1 Tax=Galemys pyrenaicus TaxID=202257 RepID=A0A8J6DQX4_GALPY|nr:Vacuolar protein sorting-associated protein 41 [Galemys pyrenaicus]